MPPALGVRVARPCNAKGALYQAEGQLNGSERPAVVGCDAIARDGREMLGGAVAFMALEAMEGIGPCQLGHDRVTRYLGHNRGRRDREAAHVPLNDGARGTLQTRCPVAIN